jgi:hypothetical protein
MVSFVILTADELIALDVEGRGKGRRAARETRTATHVLEMFLDSGGPVRVGEIVGSLRRDSDDAVHEALVELDDQDLIRISDGYVDLAYPFSASPTTFVVRLQDGRERNVCCAIDALGIAPMIGEAVEIGARCHHSGTTLQFAVTAEGPAAGSAGIMLWVGKRPEERCRGIDAL